jgi:hypothetical protein
MELRSTSLVSLRWLGKMNPNLAWFFLTLCRFGCGTFIEKDQVVEKINDSIAVLQRKLDREEIVYGKSRCPTHLRDLQKSCMLLLKKRVTDVNLLRSEHRIWRQRRRSDVQTHRSPTRPCTAFELRHLDERRCDAREFDVVSGLPHNIDAYVVVSRTDASPSQFHHSRSLSRLPRNY